MHDLATSAAATLVAYIVSSILCYALSKIYSFCAQEMEALQQTCKAWRVVAHAKALAAEEKLADRVQDIALTEDGNRQSKSRPP